MGLNGSLLAALIASLISVIGLFISIYINKTNNKSLENKIKIEHKLQIERERRLRLNDFLYHVKRFQYVLLDIIEILKHQEYNVSTVKTTLTEFRMHQLELREQWTKITMDIHDANMKKSINLGAYLHDNVGQIVSAIILYLNMDLSGKTNNKDRVIDLLTGYDQSLDELINLIVKEQKLNEATIH